MTDHLQDGWILLPEFCILRRYSFPGKET